MPEFDAPGWFVAALAAPLLVYWLHARRAPTAATVVPALYPWRGEGTPPAPRPSRGRRDPRWLVRAVAAALLCLAASGPRLPASGTPALVVWIDDAPSMGSVEADGLRAELAADAALEALWAAGRTSAWARALRRQRVGTELATRASGTREALVALATADAGDGGLRLPPPGSLDPAADHWLVTDGADDALDDWLARMPVSRVIQVGEAADNVALTRLAARTSLRDPGTVRALVKVSNLGPSPARRVLALRSAGTDADAVTVPLSLGPAGTPGARAAVTVDLTAGGWGILEARLEPADALAADDRLTVDAGPLDPVRVVVDPSCPAPVAAALRAHRGLIVGSPAALVVACGATAADASTPSLWFREAGGAQPLSGVPVWTPAAGTLRGLALEPRWLRVPAGAVAMGDALLESDGRTLIGMQPGPPVRIEVVLATAESPLVQQPEFAAVVAGLLDRVAGRALLDPVAGAGRLERASRIRPRPLAASADGSRVAPAASSRSLLVPLLILAMGALLADLLCNLPASPRAPWRRERGA